METASMYEQIAYRSCLVRLWRDESDWCGEIEQIQSGQIRQFRGTEQFLKLMADLLNWPHLLGLRED